MDCSIEDALGGCCRALLARHLLIEDALDADARAWSMIPDAADRDLTRRWRFER